MDTTTIAVLATSIATVILSAIPIVKRFLLSTFEIRALKQEAGLSRLRSEVEKLRAETEHLVIRQHEHEKELLSKAKSRQVESVEIKLQAVRDLLATLENLRELHVEIDADKVSKLANDLRESNSDTREMQP